MLWFWSWAALAAGQDAIDATRTVVLSNSEVVAMGGAGIGFANGASGLFLHPAAVAHRPIESRRWFRGSATLSWLTSMPGKEIDLTNTQSADGWHGGIANAGVAATLRNVGLGAAGGAMSYQQGTRKIDVNEGHLASGFTMFSGVATVGAGWRVLTMEITDGANYRQFAGSGVETGLLLASARTGINAGAVWRQAVEAVAEEPVLNAPVDRAMVPYQFAVGMAWASRAVQKVEPAIPLRIAADLVIDGPTKDATALEPRLAGDVIERGATTTFSPRLGVEIEPWHDRIKLRAGAYREPSRTQLADARLHGTGGFELKLFHLKMLWGLVDNDVTYETSFDFADRYANLSWIGIGLWSSGVVGGHPYRRQEKTTVANP